MSGGEGADVVIVAVASGRAQEQSLELAARQGRINFFGGLSKDNPHIQFNSNLVHYKQLIVTGTTGSNVRQFRSAMNLIAAGRINLDTLVGAQLSLDQIQEGIERTKSGQDMRILIQPSN
jgi:L-iditol 2-dehydrogenase